MSKARIATRRVKAQVPDAARTTPVPQRSAFTKTPEGSAHDVRNPWVARRASGLAEPSPHRPFARPAAEWGPEPSATPPGSEPLSMQLMPGLAQVGIRQSIESRLPRMATRRGEESFSSSLAQADVVQRVENPEDEQKDAQEPATFGAAKREHKAQLESNKDNSFVGSRWRRSDKTSTKYADAFNEKVKAELKKEFGQDITHDEVLSMIKSAETEGEATKAEEYRKKLFRANQYAIVEALDVEQKTSNGSVTGENALKKKFTTAQNHEMYGRTDGATYCNIYAHDVVTAMGAYIPRVWWTETYEKQAIDAMNSGEQFNVKPVYGKNTGEMNANALNAWLDRVGGYFGWRRASSMEEAQNAANEGRIVVLSAANKNAAKSGHISVILAERDQLVAQRKDGKADIPLTSQAGAKNWKHEAKSKWWNNSEHTNGAAWIHDAAIDSPLLTPEKMGVAGDKSASSITPTSSPGETATPVGTSAGDADSVKENDGLLSKITTGVQLRSHTVQPGETIEKIAHMYGITSSQLSAANKTYVFSGRSGTKVVGFQAGQNIQIPAADGASGVPSDATADTTQSAASTAQT
ncbi:MAG TPA: LysM domain-containing protein, partial [Haliangium sp.]|nr:LysM domain-containing protein [Haliangium sp.]